MQPERWKEIKRIFNDAVDLPPDEQRRFLDSTCDDSEIRREIEDMLAADSDTFMAEPLLADDESAHFKDKKIGRYRIICEVGRGGMGTVFAALRDDGEFEQKAAVKIIRRGLNTNMIARRFRQERQILASLEHPNIARLLDGGMSQEGLPFYVMEFIEGEPIDQYCRAKELKVTARLELFRQVCAAVSYAHRRLIVHRDLKPSNILVTESGQVKLLDFGIAKVLSSDAQQARNTATQLGMMTPDYASPEQFRGEQVTTATDVYSLGVVLYELLTGALPYVLTGLRLDEMLKLVCDTEPLRPSAVSGKQKTENKKFTTDEQRTGTLNGDLDNIILKALKKQPERRYDSVEQFSEDIRRYLEGLPVSARADTFAYRASKFIKRNKVSVLAASLIFLALVAGILGTTYQARVAQRERARAEKRFEQVRKLANNVVFKYHDAIATLSGATATREMLVKDAIEYLNNLSEDAGDNPALAQELALAYLKIGNAQGEIYRANLGDSEGAMRSYLKSIEILDNLTRANPEGVEYLKNLHQASQQTAFLMVRIQHWKEAEEMGQRLLTISRKLVELEPDNSEHQNLLARSYQIKGDTVEFSGGDEETIKWYRQALEEAEKIFEKNPTGEMARRLLTVALQRVGTRLEYYAETLREIKAPDSQIAALYAEAEQLHRRSVELSESLRRDFPQNEAYTRFVAATSTNLGTAMARVGRGNEGVPYILRSLSTMRAISESDPNNNEAKRDIAEQWQYMAFARAAMNQTREAIEANQKSLKILEEVTANDPSNFEFLKQTHLTYNNTGDIFLREGKLTEALAYYQKGMAYAAKMSAVNDSSQIAVLRSESNRKIGEAYLDIAAASKNADLIRTARTYLLKAREDLLALKQRNELGKNYEHRLDLIERAIDKTA
jgi:non-specific serine/threonine protein kinase/serine/threonine-protein kinase